MRHPLLSLPILLSCLISVAIGAAAGYFLKPAPVVEDPDPPRLSYTPLPEIPEPKELQGKIRFFVFAGQSNMSGRGDLNTPNIINATDPKILLLGNDHKWHLAQEPLDSPANQVDEVSIDPNAAYSMGMSFAHTVLAANPDETIGLIPCARGGSGIEMWQKSDDPKSLYRACMEKVRIAQQFGTISGLLIHQGESDAGTAPSNRELAPRWHERFSQFVGDFRKDVGNEHLPVIYAQLARLTRPARFPYWEAVRDSQAKVHLDQCKMIITEDLEVFDYAHLAAKAVETMGRRYAEGYLELSRQ